MKILLTLLSLSSFALAQQIACYDKQSLTPAEIDSMAAAGEDIVESIIISCVHRNSKPLHDCKKLPTNSQIKACLKASAPDIRSCCGESTKKICEDELYFLSYASVKKINSKEIVSIDECAHFGKHNLSMAYLDNKCSRARKIDGQFSEYIKESLPYCLKSALSGIGEKSVQAMKLKHVGILADQNHKSHSIHGQGKALDIKSLEVTRSDGSSFSLEFSEKAVKKDDSNLKFYRQFRTCWDKRNIQKNGCRSSNEGYITSSGYDDSEGASHKHHLHVEMPPSCFSL